MKQSVHKVRGAATSCQANVVKVEIELKEKKKQNYLAGYLFNPYPNNKTVIAIKESTPLAISNRAESNLNNLKL